MVQKFPEASHPPLANTKKETFENKAIVDWFTQATESQVNTQMLSHFGLKNPSDLMLLLRSPAGISVRGLMAKQIATMNALKNNVKDNQLNQQKLMMLLLGLAYKQEAAAETAEIRNIRFNEKLVEKKLDAGEKRIEAQEKKAIEASIQSSNEAAAMDYTESMEALEQILEEHNHAFDSHDIEWADIEQINRELEARDGFIANILADIDSFFDLDSEEQEKITHNDRELINSFPKEKIIAKEKGKSYLLERGQKLDELSSGEKATAHKEYNELKPDLITLQEKIKTSHQEDKNQHAERRERFIAQRSQAHQEVTLLTQQLADLQTARHVLQNQLKPTAPKQQLDPVVEQQKKQPTARQQEPKKLPVAKPELNIAVFKRSFEEMLRIDPVGTIAAQDRTGAPRFLQQTEYGMPLEQRTIESLIKHRSGRAGALANDLLTNPKALAAQRDEDRLNPDAKPQIEPQAKSALKADLQAIVTPKPNSKPPQAEQAPNSPSPFSTKPKPQ